MTVKDRKRREAQRRYIARMRTMSPDDVLTRRLDKMEEDLNAQEREQEGRHVHA